MTMTTTSKTRTQDERWEMGNDEEEASDQQMKTVIGTVNRGEQAEAERGCRPFVMAR